MKAIHRDDGAGTRGVSGRALTLAAGLMLAPLTALTTTLIRIGLPDLRVVGQFGFGGRAMLPATGFQPA